MGCLGVYLTLGTSRYLFLFSSNVNSDLLRRLVIGALISCRKLPAVVLIFTQVEPPSHNRHPFPCGSANKSKQQSVPPYLGQLTKKNLRANFAFAQLEESAQGIDITLLIQQ